MRLRKTARVQVGIEYETIVPVDAFIFTFELAECDPSTSLV